MQQRDNRFFKKNRYKTSSDSTNTGITFQRINHEDKQNLISYDLNMNLSLLKQHFAKCSDIVYREFVILKKKKALLLYIDGLIDTNQLELSVLKPLMTVEASGDESAFDFKQFLEQNLSVAQTSEVGAFTEVIDDVLAANAVLLVDGETSAIVLSTKKWSQRSVEEPLTEAVIRGPREGFTENIRTNTALLRRRIRTENLKMESMKIGRVTKTDLVIAYIDGIVTDSVVTEVKNRLGRIDIDGVLESGYIEELLEDNPFSPFPQFQNTERPDAVAANLMEGRVAIFIDGTPFVIMTPVSFFGFLQASEDYYERSMVSIFIRWVRFIFLFIALLLPSLYIAITTYHQEMLPTNLLLSVASSRESSPFPAFVEALMMEITFEALREAGVRLPRPVGSAVSIVGALVIGQAAVQAGIVSAPMVIVVSITGIASFIVPRFNLGISIRMLRFPIMILAATLGLFGIVIGLLLILIHLCGLRSLGVPYLTPVAPLTLNNLKDTFIRAPHWAMGLRPRLFGYQNPQRQKPDLMPQPDKRE
ncbi:spore germination protein [Fodinisporobacter ferrooxydans]|uniref:Spore germination protein n=1 Tax=Fodinisporobacter ferrooxydans TaxID=2901836 RepID=A0ABY4CF00_9BACL|nr:spore germination protein [Alicyclobacillaceae bacterium MYW30-H2]